MQLIGALGLSLISASLLVEARSRRNQLAIAGGLCLLAYSLTLGDMIFVVLQLVFVAAATYDSIRIRRR